MKSGKPMVAFCETPDLHDDGPKTVLGKTGNFGGEEIVKQLCAHPATAKNICTKLWQWFAYMKPEAAVIEELSAVFTRTGGDIKSVVRAIAARPEFWSEKCYRSLPKSPVDFTVGITRQLGVNDFLLGLRGANRDPLKPLPKPLRDVTGLLAGLMNQQGMLLLYPPNVGGWDWGEAWLTSQALSVRTRFADMLMGVGQADKGICNLVTMRLKTGVNPQSAPELVAGLLSIFDAELPDAKKPILAEACEKNGGVSALATPEKASSMLASVLRLIFSSPEFQHS